MPQESEGSDEFLSRKSLQNTAFGRAVYRLREEKGMTQEQLGWATGVNRSHLSELERGLREPGLDMILRLANGLKITPGELLDAAAQEFKKEERRQARKKAQENTRTSSRKSG